MSAPTTYTQDELVALLHERFGEDPMDWTFVCPICGDRCTGADMRAALAKRPRTNRDGSVTTASDLLGQECIGRVTGAPEHGTKGYAGRGCNWCAFGLFRGPWLITTLDGETIGAFPVADPAEGVVPT